MTGQHIAAAISAGLIACAVCFLAGYLAGATQEIKRSLAARMDD